MGDRKADDTGSGTVEVSYATGWDLTSRTALEPLSRAGAEARDTAGEPYVMVHRLPGRAEPLEVHLVAWAESYVGVWVYDEQGRRTRELDWRLLEPGRVFLRHIGQWTYESADQPELDAEAGHFYQDLFPDGRGRKVSEPRGRAGGSLHTTADIPPDHWWRSSKGFGVRRTAAFLFADGVARRTDVADAPEAAAGTAATATGHATGCPWLPPRPGRPACMREIFEPGTRVATRFEPEMTVLAPREIATLRLPSGRLTVADPLTPTRGAGRELAERFPPGTYRIQAATVTYEWEFMGERTRREEQVAIRLLLDEEPPAVWEMARAEEDDVRLLRDDEIVGFDTDGAAGAFADASGWDALAGRYRDFLVDGRADAAESLAEGHIRATDDATGSDLVSFYTGGDGTFPVWLGRSASGAPVSLVVVTAPLPDVRVL